MGGRLVVALATPLGDIDPVNMELVEEQEILANVFETLLATDLEGNLVPALCEKWEVSDNGTSVFFTLRENVCFQNGQSPDRSVRQGFICAEYEGGARATSRSGGDPRRSRNSPGARPRS